MTTRKHRGRNRRRPPEERREQILGAAVKLFARHGYARTTTKQIAAQAGVSEGTIYRYFASKQDLLFSFIETAGMQTLKSVLTGREGEREAELIHGFFLDRFTLAQRNLPLMKVVIGEALFDPNLARAFAEHVVRPASALLEEFITEGIASGRFRRTDPTIAARALAGLFITFGVLWPALLPGERRRHSPEPLADALTELYLEGLSLRGSMRRS